MKVCHAEVMKLIKELEKQKADVLLTERDGCLISYKEGEEPLAGEYDYEAVRREVRRLDTRIRELRATLAKANCRVLVEPFHVTIGEALVMLAQLQNERSELEMLAGYRQRTRRITSNGVLEYTECAFDVRRAASDAAALRGRIGELQVAIDRANLNSLVEI